MRQGSNSYAFVSILTIAAVALGMLLWHGRSSTRSKAVTLTIYCAAAMKPVVEAVAAQYEQTHGVRIQAQYGASGTLLSQIKLTKQGDLYLPADESFLVKAQGEQLVGATYQLASMTPVLVVLNTNPKRIISLTQVMNLQAVTLAYADPETASVGMISRAALQRSGEWRRLAPHIAVTVPTVSDVANAVNLGTVDGGIVWDAVAKQYPAMSIIHVPALDRALQRVAIGVLSISKHPKQADDFAQYLTSPAGINILRNLGYAAVAR